jgi:hypothetical protein
VLPRGNEIFVPAAELRISIYVRPSLFLALLTGAKGSFHDRSIFESGEPQCANACGFFNGDS